MEEERTQFKFVNKYELLEENNIRYTSIVPVWTDSGKLKYQNASEEELIQKFNNCCLIDKTLLSGTNVSLINSNITLYTNQYLNQ